MLTTGSKAPEISLPDQSGKVRALRDLSGPKGLVLYFYPKDNTPGCTLEAQGFRDRLEAFERAGFRVAGVSRDSAKSHCGFIEKHGLNFTLLSDAEGKLCEAFGAWGEKKNYGKTYMGIIRSTFVLGADGKLLKAYPKVSAKGHAEQVLKDLEGV